MNSQNRIEADVLLDFKDLLRTNYWSLFRKFRLTISLFVIIGVVLATSYLFLILVSESPELSKDFSSVAEIFLFLSAAMIIVLVSVYFSAKRYFASNKALQEKIHYIFSKDGIVSEAESSSSRFKWDLIREARETAHSFLLFIAHGQMIIIPRRSFASEEDIILMRELLRRELGRKAKMR